MYQTGYYATGYYSTGYYLGGGGAPGGVGLFTYQTLILEARQTLGDTDPDCYRWTDSFLVSILNRGLNELQRIRPDAWYTTLGVVPEVTENTVTLPGQTNWEADFGPDKRFYPAVLHYVTAVVQMTEDRYISSGSAMNTYEMFRMLVLDT